MLYNLKTYFEDEKRFRNNAPGTLPPPPPKVINYLRKKFSFSCATVSGG
jgi:hypothetical protein